MTLAQSVTIGGTLALRIVFAALLGAHAGLAQAQPAAQPAAVASAPGSPAEPSANTEPAPFRGPPEDENTAQYCSNIADAAADARFARQNEALLALQADIDARLALMEAKRTELEAVLKRREDLLKKADESVVAIYSKMRPDAAASQMSIMERRSAAAILEKLNPRMASAILNEMEPAKAAQLTAVMAGSAEDLKGEGES